MAIDKVFHTRLPILYYNILENTQFAVEFFPV